MATKRRAYLLYVAGEYCGPWPTVRAAMDAQEHQADRAGFDLAWRIQDMDVTRYELEGLKEDDVSDEEWADYQPARA